MTWCRWIHHNNPQVHNNNNTIVQVHVHECCSCDTKNVQMHRTCTGQAGTCTDVTFLHVQIPYMHIFVVD